MLNVHVSNECDFKIKSSVAYIFDTVCLMSDGYMYMYLTILA